MSSGAVIAATVELADIALQTGDGEDILFYLLLFGGGLYVIYSGFRTWQRMRLIQDTPTEKIRSAAVGRTELSGTGRSLGSPIYRPFGNDECLVATYEIEEWEEDHSDKHSSGHWETIESGTFVKPFQLNDGTGTVRIDATKDATFRFASDHVREIEVGAREEEPSNIVDFLRNYSDAGIPNKDGITGFLFADRRRYTEQWIPVGQELYLLGGAVPVQPDETNTSGLALKRDTASGQFIISAEPESELISDAKWMAPLKIVGGLAASAIGLYFLLSRFGF
jgi:hypothetical protein